MAIPNLAETIEAMTDAQVIPTPPTPPVDNTWIPAAAAIRIIVGRMKVYVEERKSQGEIARLIIIEARDSYGKTITRAQVKEIWDAWQADIARRASV
jgi:hypothetical protein